MEFLSELLRDACTCFLLSFLVVRFLSLIVSSSDDDNKKVQLSTEFDHCLHNHVVGDDSFGEKTQLEIDGFKGVNDANETHNEMIKYFDLDYKIKDMIVRDIDIVSNEVNAIDEDFRGSVIKDMDDQDVSKLVEFGGEFVDHDEKRFESGKNIGGVVDQVKKEPIMEFEEGKNHEDDIGVNLGGEEVERSNNVYKGEVSGREFDIEDEGVLSDDEDWEGIERSELEKTFARAMNYVGSKEKQKLLGENIDIDVIMTQFYGLQKVAMEGPCHEAQPLAIKRSARAKWNAWQKLGSMTQEDAMEEYISLLSGIIPEWMEANSIAKE